MFQATEEYHTDMTTIKIFDNKVSTLLLVIFNYKQALASKSRPISNTYSIFFLQSNGTYYDIEDFDITHHMVCQVFVMMYIFIPNDFKHFNTLSSYSHKELSRVRLYKIA